MPTPREENIYLSKLSESAERYDDMVKFMKEVKANADSEFTVEERNLLSVAYKNTIGPKRTALRILSGIAEKEKSKGGERVETVINYSNQIEDEIRGIANDVMEVTLSLIESSTTPEGKIFFHKMQGDYYRYLAEFEKDEQRAEAAENSKKSYQSAYDLASKELGATHPIRLGLVLNFSVFHYEIAEDREAACKLARDGFDEALAQLEEMGDDSKDSTLIMQLIRDNLTLWQPENDEEDN
jgi:14-3-3 protein epsilon